MTSAKERKRAKMDVSPAEEEDQETSTDNVNSVFSNSLLVENILKFLSFADIKEVSLVNSDFLHAVRGSKRWSWNAVLKLRGTMQFQNYFRNMKEPWRGVKIDVQVSPQTIDSLPRILDSVEFVALFRASPNRSSYVIKEVNTKLSAFLLSVLSATPKLTHLQMDIRFWRSRLSDLLSSPAVVANLKNLKHLGILELDYYHPGSFRDNKGQCYSVEKQPFTDNFLHLSLIPMRLESFKMAKIYSRGGPEKEFFQHLLAILRNSRETLKELSVHTAVWRMEELRELKFPALKRLTVSVDLEYQKTLAAFLKNHPTLEELDIEEGHKKISHSLLCAIQDCTKLKKLHLKAHVFSGITGNVDWTFLGSLEHLKDFAVERSENYPQLRRRAEVQNIVSYGTGRNFLASLPKNQLESLRLKGISKHINPYVVVDESSVVGFWRSSSEVDNNGLEMKIQLLQAFTCLRRLSLINSLDSLDDSLMQFIVKEFKLLEELEVSDCDNLSDAGIAGNGDVTTNSIANLRNLKTLIIRSCPLVTPDGLLSCLTLPFLKSLEFMTSDRVPESFVLKMEEQNPNLESLCVNFSGKWRELKIQLKAKNTRLKRVGKPVQDYADLEFEPAHPGERRPRI